MSPTTDPPPGGPDLTQADLVRIADELYAVSLAEFTPARDARAKELKGTDLAAPVKKLRKPSMAAWVVNLLVRRDAEQVDQVLTVGAALRAAAAAMSGDELRELTRQRRQVTAAVTTRARQLAREEGHRVTEAVADQVEATLTAAMVDERCAAAVRSGLLVTALSTTGVDEVDAEAAVAVPAALGFIATAREATPPPRPDLRVVPDPDADAKALAAAAAELARTEDAAREATEEHQRAEAALSQLTARSMQIQAEIDELKRRIADLEETADDVDEQVEVAEETYDQARAALGEAEADRDQAAGAVARIRERIG
jgi:DNA repair exonuclease SbcCD ATPase subunit